MIIIALLSGVSTIGIGRWKQLGMLKILLLVFGPAADGVIMYYFLDWISVSGK